MQVVTRSLSEFEGEARRFAAGLTEAADGATVVTLSGELGAGKTAFAQVVAKEFGIEEPVTSPTFVIEKVYELAPEAPQGFGRLIHIDAYRLDSARDLEVLGWSVLLADTRNLILIEWPERVETTIPQNAKKVKFTYLSDLERRIEIN
jgi:tRNA threonylcarbamoyladenosine biosynthesis protein TsaE